MLALVSLKPVPDAVHLHVKKRVRFSCGLLPITQIPFYRALALLALYPTDTAAQTRQLAEVEALQQRLVLWATHAPENFQHKVDLIAAETARVLNHKAQAIELYDQAIAGAKENGYIHEEAVANELAAKFYLNWEKESIAQDYLIMAYYGYARWEAVSKVKDLEQQYPQMLVEIIRQQHIEISTTETVMSTAPFAASTTRSFASYTAASSSTVTGTLDLATVLKASQALSGEIQLDNLLAVLLKMVLASSGADNRSACASGYDCAKR